MRTCQVRSYNSIEKRNTAYLSCNRIMRSDTVIINVTQLLSCRNHAIVNTEMIK